MWQDENKLAMKALMNGDNDEAISRWEQAVALAEKAEEAPSEELGELYYNLGKMLADTGVELKAIFFLKKSVNILGALEPLPQRLDTARYQLAELLRRSGKDDEATELFQQALKIEPVYSYITMKEALAHLKKCGIAVDLTGKVLKKYYNELDISDSDENIHISELLTCYYSDTKHGAARRETDRVICEHYTDFDAVRVVRALGELSGLPGLLTLVGTEESTAGGSGNNMRLTLRRDDGEEIYIGVFSVVGIANCFNQQLELRNQTMRFYDLASNNYLAFFIPAQTFEYLRDNLALQFDCDNGNPQGDDAVGEPPEPGERVERVIREGDSNVVHIDFSGERTERIFNIVEMLPQLSVDALPDALNELRQLRSDLEGTPYEYSEPETEAFEFLLSNLTATAGVAVINEKEPDDLPVEIMRFGGQPYTEEKDEWPECPQCGLSLNFVGQISESMTFADGSVNNLLLTLYYCFSHWPDVTAHGEGFVLGAYWNASREKFFAIEPKKKLSRPPMPAVDCNWLEPMEYLPSAREVAPEELGIPEDYYQQRFQEKLNAIRESAHILGGGPYPDNARLLECEICDQDLNTAYTIYLDGTFTIVACPSHPDGAIAFHSGDESR